VICADWGKESRKRSVYVADVVQRTIRRLESDAWTLAGILRNAEMWASRGTVMVAVDAPLGIPASFLSAVARLQPLAPPRGFLNVLEWAKKQQNFFVATSRPEDWRVERPFFAVPGVPGGLTAYRTAGQSTASQERTLRSPLGNPGQRWKWSLRALAGTSNSPSTRTKLPCLAVRRQTG
jgi:hypothetical protein